MYKESISLMEAEGETGKQYEETFVESNPQGWDHEQYLLFKEERRKSEATRQYEDFIESNKIDTVARWNERSVEEKKEILLKWFMEHQPEDWHPELLDERYFRAEEVLIILQEELEGINKKRLKEAGINDTKSAKIDSSKIHFYTTANSILDTCYGIDGFVEYMGGIITFDFSLNPIKKEGKADIIVTPAKFDNGALMLRMELKQFLG